MRDLIRAIDPEAIERNAESLSALEASLRDSHQRTDAARNKIRNVLFGILLLIAIAISVVCVATIVLVLRSSRERARAFRDLEATKDGLEKTVAERTAKLIQANTETQRTSRVLYNTIDSMADAVIVADSNGRIILANQQANSVLGPLDSFNTERWDDIYELTQPDGTTPVPQHERPIARALNGEEFDNCQLLLRKRGTTKGVSLQVTTRTIRDSNCGSEGIIAVYRDVTAIQETERQLRDAQKMEALGRLTGGIAHDFNNILTVILGTIGMLQEAVADRPDLEEIASMIDEAAGRGADLTQELLAFARKQPLQPQAVDVPALLSSTIKLLKPSLGEHIDIKVSRQDAVLPALADPSQLATAILNLAVNARDAMPHGGQVTIEIENVVLDEEQISGMPDVKPGAYVAITVTDSGEGMTPDIRERIFEPFFTTKDVGRGTGLGLAMVYGFVKQSNGHIQVYSEVGYGTSFKLLLPSADIAAMSFADEDDRNSADRQRKHSGGRGRQAGQQFADPAIDRARLPDQPRGDRESGAEADPGRTAFRSADDRYRAARWHERTGTRAGSAAAAAGDQGPLHLGLQQGRHHPSRPPGFRCAAADQTLSQGETRAGSAAGARCAGTVMGAERIAPVRAPRLLVDATSPNCSPAQQQMNPCRL